MSRDQPGRLRHVRLAVREGDVERGHGAALRRDFHPVRMRALGLLRPQSVAVRGSKPAARGGAREPPAGRRTTTRSLQGREARCPSCIERRRSTTTATCATRLTERVLQGDLRNRPALARPSAQTDGAASAAAPADRDLGARGARARSSARRSRRRSSSGTPARRLGARCCSTSRREGKADRRAAVQPACRRMIERAEARERARRSRRSKAALKRQAFVLALRRGARDRRAAEARARHAGPAHAASSAARDGRCARAAS